MLTFHGSSSLVVRALAVLVAIAVVLSLWMHYSLSTDRLFNAQPSFGSNPSSNMSLIDVFFPVSDSPEINPLTRENSKMLHALVTCIEHRNCHQNQTKGSSISTYISVPRRHISNSHHIGFFVLSRIPPGFERWRINLVRVPDPCFVLQLSHLAQQGTLHSTWLILVS